MIAFRLASARELIRWVLLLEFEFFTACPFALVLLLVDLFVDRLRFALIIENEKLDSLVWFLWAPWQSSRLNLL